MKRIYQIDLFRFIAAFFVVLYHYVFRAHYINILSNEKIGALAGIFKYGYLGVDVFFIISGFVIVLSIKKRDISKFVISRISRLYPIYWICVLLTFIITLLYGMPMFSVTFKQLLPNLTMFQNYLGVENIDGVYWTLFIEMKFYIFVIGTYLVLNKIINISLDYLIYFWILLSVVYLFFNDLFLMKVMNYFFVLEWSSYFISGVVFYQIFVKGLKIRYLSMLTVCLFIALHYAIINCKVLGEIYNTTFSIYIVCFILCAFYVLMLLISLNKLTFFNSPKLVKLGMLTYPLYLLHQNIGYIIFQNYSNPNNEILIVSSTILLMVFISYILSVYYEPFIMVNLKAQLEKIIIKKYSWNNDKLIK